MRETSTTRLRFAALASGNDTELDLGRAALLIAAEEYPDLEVNRWLGRIDHLARELAPRLEEHQDDAGRLGALIHFLFNELGFEGNHADYYDPRNSFLNDVLERRKGIPISLAAIYLEIGKRVGLPLYGVCFPGHFLIGFGDENRVFFDPFDPEHPMIAQDCQELLAELTQGKAKWHSAFIEPASPRLILVRMLTNLKMIYLRGEDFGRALACVQRILLLNSELTREYLDRALLHERLDSLRLAEADLELYLERPDARRRSEAEGKLAEIRGRLAMFH